MTMQFIMGNTITNNSTISFQFTNIPTTFTHLELHTFQRVTQAGSGIVDVWIYFNNDFAANYVRHALYGLGDSATPTANSGTAQIGIPFGTAPQASATAGTFGSSIINIQDNNNPNKNTVLRAIQGVDLNGSGIIRYQSGLWLNKSPITTMEISTGNAGYYLAQGSSFQLYGFNTSEQSGA